MAQMRKSGFCNSIKVNHASGGETRRISAVPSGKLEIVMRISKMNREDLKDLEGKPVRTPD